MVKTGFSIGDRDWWIMVYLPVTTERELSEVYGTLLACGCPDYKAQNACMMLSKYNKGYTYTNFKDRSTVVFASKATSPSELYDSLLIEICKACGYASGVVAIDVALYDGVKFSDSGRYRLYGGLWCLIKCL